VGIGSVKVKLKLDNPIFDGAPSAYSNAVARETSSTTVNWFQNHSENSGWVA